MNLRLKSLLLFLLLLLPLAGCQAGKANSGSKSSGLSSASEQMQNEDLLMFLQITELMPANKDCLYDQDGDSSDWLEIANNGEQPVSLKDCVLTLQDGRRHSWCFPDVELAGRERIIVFCSGKDRTGSELHANFTLDKEGDTVNLFSPAGALLDSVSYPEMEQDMSITFPSGTIDPDSTVELNITYQATPGYANSPEGYELFISEWDNHGPLVINEAVSYNGIFPEKPGQYYDWIELKNTSDGSLQLSDYFLSDQSNRSIRVQLPDMSLMAGETFIVYCSGNSSLSSQDYFHADFEIGSEDRIYLTDKDGALVDRLFIHGIPINGSVGRVDSEAGFWYFPNPTPNQENGEGFRRISSKPAASVKPGVYQTDQSLQVVLNGNGTIYYTLDGSAPNLTDQIYSDPITVSETTIIRAICKEENCLCSSPVSFSYIMNENDHLPVTSLVCDPQQMFGYNGVYTAPRGLNSKCDATVSFFDNGGGFTADCSVELHGAHSRTTFKKKSFELKFSARYGGDVAYDLFEDGIRTRFSTLLLRGGSSANLDTVRDCFASKCMLEVCPWMFPQNTRYTSVYINGEYYGIYAWREAYSEQYFADHTGMPEEEISMVRGPVSGGQLLALLNEIAEKSAVSDEDYERFAAQLDMNSLAGWMAIQSFFNNQDINGNIRYVRLAENGRWQLIVYDLDYSCLTDTTGWDTVISSYQLGPVCRSLLTNHQFRDVLLKTCAEFTQNGFTAAHLQELYDELLAPLDETTIQKECQRWSDEPGRWAKNIKAMRNHLTENRMADWLNGLKALTKATEEQMHGLFPQYF